MDFHSEAVEGWDEVVERRGGVVGRSVRMVKWRILEYQGGVAGYVLERVDEVVD